MNESRSNNIEYIICPNNSELYQALLHRLEEFKNRDNVQILKNNFRIFTRENLTTDYIAFKLVEDNIPSLLFEVTPYRTIAREFLKKPISADDLISDLSCILLIENIFKTKKESTHSKTNKRVLRQLATDIFKFWKDSLLSDSISKEKIPSNIKEEYYEVIREFIKKKRPKKIELEHLYDLCRDQKNFLSEKDAKQKFGEEIILYGVSEIDPLHFNILKILSQYIKISIFLPVPILSVIHKEKDLLTKKDVKLRELLPEWHVLTYAENDKSLKLDELIQASNRININPDSLRFYESQEAYREIEFIGGEILRLMEKNKSNPDFRLTSIKLVLPTEDTNYALIVNNVFDRMKIPYAFTKDIRKKKTPYIAAVVSLLKISVSDFDKDTIFSLFYNPCFHPEIQESREDINPDVWNQIIARMNLSGFLDKYHKRREGLRETNLMTWESLWKRLDSILVHQDEESSLEPELVEEAYQLLEISSSLLQDLIGFKEDFSSLKDFSRFFRILLDTYLNPSMRNKPSTDPERLIQLNQRGQSKVYSLLSALEAIEEELESIKADNIHFTLEDFVETLLEQIDSWTEGDSRVLKNGVVVGELLDAVDPIFDFVYLVGLDDRRLGRSSTRLESLMQEENIQLSRKNSSLKVKNYFAHIFHHTAQEYFFSYVSLDTIKDREFYPAVELDWIRTEYGKKKYNKIPLFSYLEYRQSDLNAFDRDSFSLIDLKKKEAELNFLKAAYPNWDGNEVLNQEIDLITRDEFLKQKIKSYFQKSYESTGVYKEMTQSQNMSVAGFMKYIHCPKKFFFDYSIQTEEEEETEGDIDSIDSFRWHLFLKEALYNLLEDPSLSAEQLTKKILSPKRVEFGEVPFGVLGKITEFDLLEYLERVTTIYREIMLKYKIFGKTVFNSKAIKANNSLKFSTLDLPNKQISASADLLLLDGSNLYLTQIITAKDIDDIKKLNVGYTAYLVQNSNGKEELEKFFKMKLNIFPAYLHLNRNIEPKLRIDSIEMFSDKIFDPFWAGLVNDKYPPAPYNLTKNGHCKYCSVKTVCHGYHREFVPFLPDEINQIKNLSKALFKNK
ncbi:MAG TPA: exodeoxyribonuclease V subunit gamma [Leptospiraceae bacterium]|nr:exodeoxyribonuclease V subunit gamma [Leptospiraceae bacterium]HMW03888.1 exodeoxyribonuclease V subunit gamma [Leptospiraceae bacterium]HMX32398.1 exodeoxyribonuclease V subunit gamma [Leptospiraceae bacterium]HMY29868.1 exodeoxyribonuclease V subunit gamma [Leptospiraceae bacterium]HMZ62988.1 exodeoxyribonuclease V subunit gamma [Leptospiraceae bacterium]